MSCYATVTGTPDSKVGDREPAHSQIFRKTLYDLLCWQTPNHFLRSMPRRVLYDTTSRAAAAAAELLRGEFDVAPLSASADPSASGSAVVLVGRDGVDRRWGEGGLRVVALVNPDAPGPGPPPRAPRL